MSGSQLNPNIASTLAIGRATQASIGPDGVIDQSALRARIANDPDAAYGAQAAVGTSQDQQDQAYKNNAAALGSRRRAPASFRPPWRRCSRRATTCSRKRSTGLWRA